jgi:peptidoglycan hydrolase CwlO-like protein
MKALGLLKKITASALAAAVTVGVMVSSGVTDISADTQSELEAKQAELAQQKKEIEAALAASEGEADETEKYLEEYDEKMRIQEEEIAVIDEQIALYESEIEELNTQIEAKEAEIDEGIEQFRQRLRALYIAGNDSYASVLVGATDF